MKRTRKAVLFTGIILTATFVLSLVLVGCDRKKRYYNTTEVEVVDEETKKATEENTTNLGDLSGLLEELTKKVDDLAERVGALEECCETNKTELTSIDDTISSIDSRLTTLENNVGGFKKKDNDLILEGCNLVVRDAESGDRVEGVGNILVGREGKDKYAEFYGQDPIRTGSNNIIVGGTNQYIGSGGLCVGALNSLEGDHSVCFACENRTEGQFSTVTGGTLNKAKGQFSSIGGGQGRTVNGNSDWRAGQYFANH